MIENQYPIGKFTFSTDPDKQERERLIGNLEKLPSEFKASIQDLTDDQLDTPYRSGGWTVRQVVHHLADSHLNSYIRYKWTLTEDQPMIKDYNQDLWVETPDISQAPPGMSLSLLEAIHERWTYLLKTLSDKDFERIFRHPDMGEMSLNQAMPLYDWHGRHHTAQIWGLRKKMGW